MLVKMLTEKEVKIKKMYIFMYGGEHEAGKGSNMIASALEDSFKNVFGTLLDAKDTLRLFSDSCFGQNKNVNVLSMLFRYNKLMSKFRYILYFPNPRTQLPSGRSHFRQSRTGDQEKGHHFTS